MNSSDFENCGFTHSHYKACIEYALENGYKFLRMKDAIKELLDDKLILMRHDEDFSLPAAYNLAKIEGDLGIRATYFVRLHAKNYNLLSQESYTLVQNIIEMGHEIGLHYELHAHPALLQREKEIFENSRSLLESLFGTEITGMSYHEPARIMNEDDKRELPSGIQYEAYEERFMNNFVLYKYYSINNGSVWKTILHLIRSRRHYILEKRFKIVFP